jgi:hypothetical protein
MPISLDDLATNVEIRDKVFLFNDVNLDVPPDEDGSWIRVDGSADFSVIARDGSGGLFLVTPQSRRIIYASSEGEAGAIAADPAALVTLLATCPWWQDLLKYSRNGMDVAEMRRAAPFLEATWMGDEDELAQAREVLASALGMAGPGDVIDALHRAVSTPVDVRFHGVPARSLFGRFAIDDNPLYRMQGE